MSVAVNICCGRVIAQNLDFNVSYQNTFVFCVQVNVFIF